METRYGNQTSDPRQISTNLSELRNMISSQKKCVVFLVFVLAAFFLEGGQAFLTGGQVGKKTIEVSMLASMLKPKNISNILKVYML